MAFLVAHHALFLDWETGPRHYGAQAYDQVIDGLRAQLQPYAIRGWHCTRLTEQEAAAILKDGMQPAEGAMLRRRIDALVASGAVAPELATTLKAVNQADEPNRAEMVWFCFYPPARAGESGISRFFRHWGGEALYNSHEEDPVAPPVLARIGVPCLIEAECRSPRWSRMAACRARSRGASWSAAATGPASPSTTRTGSGGPCPPAAFGALSAFRRLTSSPWRDAPASARRSACGCSVITALPRRLSP